MRAAKKLILLLAALYLTGAGLAFVFQRDLIYHPWPGLKAPQDYGIPMQEVKLAAEDGVQLTAWYRPAAPGALTLVFFHGNSGNLSRNLQEIQRFLATDYGVLALDYRGFGASEGSPFEAGLYADGRATLRWLEGQGVKQGSMILYGQSLGTAVAVQMATEFSDIRALVLHAPFTSMAEVGQVKYPYLPVSLMLHDHFDSLSKIKNVHAPLLITHGEADEIVPVEEGRALLAAANEPKRGVFTPGVGHNTQDMDKNLAALQELLAATRSERNTPY